MTKWIDVFSLVVTLCGVIIAIFSVLVAFLLGRKYTEHVAELTHVRNEYHRLTELLNVANNRNGHTIGILRIALSTLFSLIVIERRKENITRYLTLLREQGVWAGRKVSAERKAVLENSFSQELNRIERDAQARQHDMYVLTGSQRNRRAYLHALVDTFGDRESLRVLEALADLNLEDWDQNELMESKVALRHRGRFSQPRMIESGSWTGTT